ncbi:MAG: arylsulfatase [Allomuricauda sp.]|nr:MAG: arylsulfatase [Allomuricauda sp.]
MRGLLLVGTLLFIACNHKQKNQETPKNVQPNILVIMLDDLGYSDFGCFGSEIKTPNIDALAENGIRFTNFKTAPMCAPSRSMFLSGNNNVTVGHGRMLRPSKDAALYGKQGYESEITDRIVTFSKLLQDNGYYNAVVGKWHQGHSPQSYPINHGFEDSWVLTDGYSNHFNNRGLGLVGRDTLTEFVNNDKIVAWEEGAFSTDFYTNKMIEYLNKAKAKKQPFFGFASYTAPHWPLQLPDDWLEKELYKGVYDDGYEALRKKRFKALQKKGIIPANTEFPPPMDMFKPWEELTIPQQKRESRKMELYAGMVEHADFHIGRLIQTLKENGQFENTIVLVLSDNGASDTDLYNEPKRGIYCRKYHSNEMPNMGRESSWVSHGKPWANSLMSPFLGFKTWASEGGIASPLIVSGSGITEKGVIKKELITIQDLAPTFLDLAEVKYPEKYNDKPVIPMLGKSMANYWKDSNGHSPYDESSIFVAENRDHAMLLKEHWKIVNFGKAADTSQFKLFNLNTDLGERTDLSEEYPAKKQELLEEWLAFKEEVGILLSEPIPN